MLVAAFAQYFFGISIFLSSLFLVMLVLVQRGRGGGLTGALGGAGGQSAFGTKAGDLFTRITVGVAAVWIFLCASAVFFLKDRALPTMGGNVSSTVSSSAAGDIGGVSSSSGVTSGSDVVLPSGATALPGGANAEMGNDAQLTPLDLPAAQGGVELGTEATATGTAIEAEVTDPSQLK